MMSGFAARNHLRSPVTWTPFAPRYSICLFATIGRDSRHSGPWTQTFRNTGRNLVDRPKQALSFSDVDYDEALRRARELIPLLREQAPKCEALGRLTPEVMDAFHRTGLLRYLQPKMW